MEFTHSTAGILRNSDLLRCRRFTGVRAPTRTDVASFRCQPAVAGIFQRSAPCRPVIQRDSKVLPVAEFLPQSAFGVNATISPSGALAAVTWFVPDSECRTYVGSTFCQTGALLDLKRGVR